MAIKKIYFGSIGPFRYDDTDLVNDPDGDFAGETLKPVLSDGDIKIEGDLQIDGLQLNDLTASRPVVTNGSKVLASADLASWVAGTADEITVSDDGDGSVTIEGAGSDTDFTVVTAIQAGGAGGVGFQYKTRALTLNGGIITTVGAESGWNDV